AVARFDRLGYRDDQLTLFDADHMAEDRTTVVGSVPGDVFTPRPAAVHPAGEAAGEDLHQRLHLGGRGRVPVARCQTVEEFPVPMSHGRNVFRLFLAALNLERMDAGVG